MQVTMEVFLTELGISAQPLQESYEQYGKWITSTWLKSVWEKVKMFSITVEIAPLPVCPPREGDTWFMQAAMEAGITNTNERRILKQFCCRQQVLYVSYVLDAGGKCLNKIYIGHRKPDNLVNPNIPSRETPTNTSSSGGRCFTQSLREDKSKIRLGDSRQMATRSGNGIMMKNPTRFTTSKEW